MNVKEYLKENILLFDGATGTYFSSIYEDTMYRCEFANITNPNLIKEIHTRYLQAGAKAIKTNTFSVKSSNEFSKREIIEEGYKIACAAAEKFDAFVFADIGYIGTKINEDKFLEYKEIVDVFLDLGAKNFLFETLADDEGIVEIANYIREKDKESFMIVSFAISAEGVTANGKFAQSLLRKYNEVASIDVVGFNCICGPLHINRVLQTVEMPEKKMVTIMPNAGYPTILGSRTSYGDNPVYFANQMMEILKNPVQIIGGCCGTTPDFIRELKGLLDHHKQQVDSPQRKYTKDTKKVIRVNRFYEKLKKNDKPIAVELDSPLVDDVKNFMRNTEMLKKVGADMITIADCPVARARMDSSLLACKIKREVGMDAMPHLTCRDRNINASKALLLGLSVEDVNNVLIVTGDPVPSAFRDEVKTVFQYNSSVLINHISNLNETIFSSPFYLYAALNLNAVNFDVQLKTAQKKEESGAMGFFTQPVHSERAIENLKKAKEILSVPIMVGIMPIVSYRNANFMNNEVPGIVVSEEIIKSYEGKTAEECGEIAVKISCDIIDKVEPYADGFYLITLFGKIEPVCKIIEYIQRDK